MQTSTWCRPLLPSLPLVALLVALSAPTSAPASERFELVYDGPGSSPCFLIQ